MSEISGTTPESYMTGDFENIHELQNDIRLKDESEKVEISGEARKKIEGFVSHIEPKFDELLDQLAEPEKYGSTAQAEQSVPNSNSFLFGEGKALVCYNDNSYLDTIDESQGLRMNLPILGNNSLRQIFFRVILNPNEELGFIKDLPKDSQIQIQELFDKVNKQAYEIVQHEDVKEMFEKYKALSYALYSDGDQETINNYVQKVTGDDKHFIEDLVGEEWPTNFLQNKSFEAYPDLRDGLYAACDRLKHTLSKKLIDLEQKTLSSNPEIIDAYKDVIEALKQLLK